MANTYFMDGDIENSKTYLDNYFKSKIGNKPDLYENDALELNMLIHENLMDSTGLVVMGKATLLFHQQKLDQSDSLLSQYKEQNPDTPLKDTINQLITRDNLSTVKILGRLCQNDTLNLMKKAKFLIFPSTCYEGFPNTLVEALACGLPVITSKLGGMAEIIEDGVTGLHFQAGNQKDLAEKIRWLIDHPAETDAMDEKAYEWLQQQFSLDEMIARTLAVYHPAAGDYTIESKKYGS